MFVEIHRLNRELELRPNEAIKELRRLVCHARHTNSEHLNDLMYLIAKYYYITSDFERARKITESWMETHSLESDSRMKFLNMLAVCLHVLGYIGDAFIAYTEVAKLAKQEENIEMQYFITINLGKMMNDVGEYEKAIEFYLKTAGLAKVEPQITAQANLYIAETLTHLSRYEEAIQAASDAGSYFEGRGDKRRVAYVNGCYGDIYAHSKDYEKARTYYEMALVPLKIEGDGRDLGVLYRKYAKLLFRSECYEEAVISFTAAIGYLEAAQLPNLIQDAYFLMGQCYEALGNFTKALECYKANVRQGETLRILKNKQTIRMLDVHVEKERVLYESELAHESSQRLNVLNQSIETETRSIATAVDKLAQIKALSLELTKAKSIEALFNISLSHLPTVLGFKHFWLGLADESGNAVTLHRGNQMGASHHVADLPLNMPSYVKHVIETGNTLRIENESALLSIHSFSTEGVGPQEDTPSAMYVPLLDFVKCFGVLVVQHVHHDYYDQYDEAVFMAFSAALSAAITLLRQNGAINKQTELHQKLLVDLKRKNKMLAELSYHDALTGLYNRAGMHYCLEQWLMSTPMPAEMVAVVMDLDHFKRFNDRFGHILGDALIREMGQLITAIFDKPDYLLTRFGGEEFLLIASSRHFWDIIKKSEDLRIAVTTLNLSAQLNWPLSISIGIKSGFVASQDALYQLIEGADQQLYQAKQTGRNRICTA